MAKRRRQAYGQALIPVFGVYVVEASHQAGIRRCACRFEIRYSERDVDVSRVLKERLEVPLLVRRQAWIHTADRTYIPRLDCASVCFHRGRDVGGFGGVTTGAVVTT